MKKSTSNESEKPSIKLPEKIEYKTINLLNIVFYLAVAILLIYPLHTISIQKILACYGLLFMVALASLLTGALPGFLFGIPRRRRETNNPAHTANSNQYEPNTNLEQVSDWLTKILVGAGLTQITSIPPMAQELGETISSASGKSISSAIASSLTIFYFILGFLYSYLWTKLYFENEMSAADILKMYDRAAEDRLEIDFNDVTTNIENKTPVLEQKLADYFDKRLENK